MTLISIMPFTRQIIIILKIVTPLNWFAITILALVPLLNPLIYSLRIPPQV
jgi:hypothetical protein